MVQEGNPQKLSTDFLLGDLVDKNRDFQGTETVTCLVHLKRRKCRDPCRPLGDYMTPADPDIFITLPWIPQGTSSSPWHPRWGEPVLGWKILATEPEWSFSLGHCEYHEKIYQWRPTVTPASLWFSRDRKDIHHSSLGETAVQRQRFWPHGLEAECFTQSRTRYHPGTKSELC